MQRATPFQFEKVKVIKSSHAYKAGKLSCIRAMHRDLGLTAEATPTP